MDEDNFILSAEYFISGFCFKYSSETITVLMHMPFSACITLFFIQKPPLHVIIFPYNTTLHQQLDKLTKNSNFLSFLQ